MQCACEFNFFISGVPGENNHSEDIPMALNPAGYVIKAFLRATLAGILASDVGYPHTNNRYGFLLSGR